MRKELVQTGTKSQIYIDEIKDEDVLIAKRKGKIIACICMDQDLGWTAQFIKGVSVSDNNLCELISIPEFKECKFDVEQNEF